MPFRNAGSSSLFPVITDSVAGAFFVEWAGDEQYAGATQGPVGGPRAGRPGRTAIVGRDLTNEDDAPGGRAARPAEAVNPTLATAEAVSLLYQELRRLARARLAAEREGHSLQPTGLAHETVMRILASGREDWASRTHFFAAASETMRRVLVDAARRRGRLKHGAGMTRIPVVIESLVEPETAAEVIALGDAVEALAETDGDAADMVKLRYFGGLTMAEAAGAMGISTRSADRLWAFARAWLARELGAASPRA